MTRVEPGRLVARIWRGCRVRMLTRHRMTQMLEEAPFRDDVARQLGITERVQFMLRVSYLAQDPDPVSMRMPRARFVRTP